MMSLRMKISPPVRLTWKPGLIGEGGAQRLERQLLPPLAFDVQQVADVAELAVQVAPHGRFVDGADRKAIGAAGLLVEKALDATFVASRRKRAQACRANGSARALVAMDSRRRAKPARDGELSHACLQHARADGAGEAQQGKARRHRAVSSDSAIPMCHLPSAM